MKLEGSEKNMFKEKQSLIKARAKALQQAEDLIEELKASKDYYKQMATEQRGLLTKQDEVIESILKLASSNTYNNDKIVLSKIKELAKTAILD